MAAALLMLLSMATGAAALELPQAAYGGSGEDILREVVSCGDGLFATGTTASDDADLDMRTRSGETGWALRLDADGTVRFGYCSARAGMMRMTAPAAFDDGTYSVMLTDEAGQRGDWIVLDERGRQLSRVTLPQVPVLCAHDGRIAQTLGVSAPDGAQLYVFLAHEAGGACCVRIAQDGSVQNRRELPGVVGRAASDGQAAACAGLEDGRLWICHLTDGEDRLIRVPADVQIERVADIAIGEDESVTLCGETAAGGGYLLRVSRAGELLFFRETDAPVTQLTETDTGFAALAAGSVLFADEDGAPLGQAPAPENTLDLAASPGGAAALSQDGSRGRRQAVFSHVAQPEALPEAQEAAESFEAGSGTIAAGEGYLLCSAQDAFGVQVRHMAADGTELFCTRTPIHTAADALEWRCAAVLEDGDMLLGGRYLTGEGENMRQEGVCALLTQGGVLRRMDTIIGAGAVCAIELSQDGEVLLHACGDSRPALEPDTVVVYSREKE